MQFSREDLLSANNILSDVLEEMNDKDIKIFSKGYYVSLIQQALEELSIDTKFFEIVRDLPFPAETLKLPYPKNCFNLTRIYLFNGDNCSVDDMQNVYYKQDYITQGKDLGYTADVHTQTKDPFNNYYGKGYDSNVHYFNVQNGVIMFSSSCIGFQKVRIVFNGTITELGDEPMIPKLARQGVAGWVVCECYKRLITRSPNLYRALWQGKYQEVHGEFTGLWFKAKKRLREIDDKLMRDVKEYHSKANE